MRQNFEEFFEEIKNKYGNELLEDSRVAKANNRKVILSYFKSPVFWIVFILTMLLFGGRIIASTFIKIIESISTIGTASNSGFTLIFNILVFLISIFFIVMINAIFGVIYYSIKSSKEKTGIDDKFKYAVYDKMLSIFKPGLRLASEEEKEKYENFNWQNEYNRFFYSSYNDSDYGDIILLRNENNIKMHGIEMDLSYVTEDSDGHTHSKTIFKGLFCEYNLNKSINSTVRIYSDKTKLKSKEENRINMDSSEFEENFDIYSNNGIAAMQILTADVMSYLIELKKMKMFEIVISNNRIYFKIDSENLFDINILKTKKNQTELDDLKKQLYDNYYILNFVFSIINEIEKNVEEHF